MRDWKSYPLRIVRGDFIALVERGRDYVVHAARRDDAYLTACGRTMFTANETDSLNTYTTCRNCLRRLPK